MGAPQMEDQARGREGAVLKIDCLNQNQSLLYATHQLATRIGIVAANAQYSGKTTSAIRPSIVNTPQKTFFSIPRF